MAVSFNVPQSPQKDVKVIQTFLGVDFTSSPDNVEITRSPDALNMVPSCPGKVRKSLGYALDYEPTQAYSDYGNLVAFKEYNNGRGVYRFTKEIIVRNGGTENAIVGYPHPNDIKSFWNESWDNNVIVGYSTSAGGDVKLAGGAQVAGKTPLFTISRNPSGGGTPYEGLNMLSEKFTDSFLSDGTSKVYQLSFGNVTGVTVQQLNSSGKWVATSISFTVNETTGAVTFASAPPSSPVGGEDNIRITATMKNYTKRLTIAKCRVSCIYGDDKQSRRLIVGSTNDAHMGNRFWFSASNDYTYIPEINYVSAGNESSNILGFGNVGNELVVFKDAKEQDTNIMFFTVDSLSDDLKTEYFRGVASLQSDVLLSAESISYLNGELLYLSDKGINAITVANYSGEKISIKRSYYLDGKLNKENATYRANSTATIYKGMYVLHVNKHLYILDGNQPVYNSATNQFYDKQYCAFYRELTNNSIGISCVNDNLYIATKEGKRYKFYSNADDIYSYADDGRKISCHWSTPDIVGTLFYKNKTLRYIALKCDASLATSVKVWVMERGLWNLVKDDHVFGNYFQFTKIIFSKFSFSTDKTQRICRTKVRVKKVDKFRLKFSNEELNESFGISSIGLEYVESGNYKG